MREEEKNREGEREKREAAGGKKRKKETGQVGSTRPGLLSETLPSSVMDRVATSFNPIKPNLNPIQSPIPK
jgi:hypothetical protein